jgi:hypothetical protein
VFLLLQSHVAKLRQSTSMVESPLDSNLESVLPGVHSRLSAMQNNMAEGFKLSAEAMLLFEARDIKRDEARELKTVQNNEKLARLFRTAADTFVESPVGTSERTEGGGGGGGGEPRTTNSNRQQAAASSLSEDALFDLAKRSKMAPRHLSLESVYFEWFGLETFKDKPIVGGLEKCEKLFQSKWRKGRTHGEKKHFSRLKRVMEGIENKARTDGVDLAEVLDSLSEIYQKDCKKSIALMESHMVRNGMIPKGKTRATPI